MTTAVNFVFVPYPVPVGSGIGWAKRAKPAPYPREDRGRRAAANPRCQFATSARHGR